MNSYRWLQRFSPRLRPRRSSTPTTHRHSQPSSGANGGAKKGTVSTPIMDASAIKREILSPQSGDVSKQKVARSHGESPWKLRGSRTVMENSIGWRWRWWRLAVEWMASPYLQLWQQRTCSKKGVSYTTKRQSNDIEGNLTDGNIAMCFGGRGVRDRAGTSCLTLDQLEDKLN